MGAGCYENCKYDPKECMIQGCYKSLEIIASLEEERSKLMNVISELEDLVLVQFDVIKFLNEKKEV